MEGMFGGIERGKKQVEGFLFDMNLIWFWWLSYAFQSELSIHSKNIKTFNEMVCVYRQHNKVMIR